MTGKSFPFSKTQARHIQRPGKVTGFSLVEVLVAVAVIAVLVGLAVVGFKSVGTSSQQGATRALLQTCETMLAELERSNNSSLPKQKIRAWAWNPAAPSLIQQVIASNPAVVDRTGTAPQNFAALNLDFWYNPQRYRAAGTVIATDRPAPIDAPGDVRVGVSGAGEAADIQRYASPVVINTAIAMSVIATIPANEQALAAIPADRLMNPLWRRGISAPAPAVNVDYPLGARVAQQIGASIVNYVALRSNRAPQLSLASPPPVVPTALPATDWAPASKPTRILLDAWNNPMIFVPASGMNVGTLHQDGKAYKTGDRVYVLATAGNPQSARTYYVAARDTITTPGASSDWRGPELTSPNTEYRDDFPAAVISPTGRPFFASAGPDGDFSTHDDNLYSFDN